VATEDEDFRALAGSFEDANPSYLRYLEGAGAKKAHMDPTGPNAFRVQAEYLQELGDNQHPLDILRRISLNPWVAPKDRIAASKSLLEYCMAKMPTKIEADTKATQAIEIDHKALKNLSAVELDTMIKLLDKAANIE
jgi:hypothetical protein